jgi:hypothetical protein
MRSKIVSDSKPFVDIYFKFALVVAGLTIGVAWPEIAAADRILWDIDPSQSYFKISIPDQPVGTLGTVQMRDAPSGSTSWTVGNQAPIDGLIGTEFTGAHLQLLGGVDSSIVGVDTGSYRPNPAAFNAANTNAANPDGQYSNTTSGAAVFGSKIRANNGPFTTDVAYWSANNVTYDITAGQTLFEYNGFGLGLLNPSATLGIFSNASQTVATGMLNMDNLVVPIIGQILPDMVGSPTTIFGGANSGAGAIGIVSGNKLEIALTFNMSVPLLNSSGFAVNGQVAGKLVAFANYTPTFGILDGDFEHDHSSWQMGGSGAEIIEHAGNHVLSLGGGPTYNLFYAKAGQVLSFEAESGVNLDSVNTDGSMRAILYLDSINNQLSTPIYDITHHVSINPNDLGSGFHDTVTGFGPLNYVFPSDGWYKIHSSGGSGNLGFYYFDNFQLDAVPEPSSIALALVGAFGCAVAAGWRKKSNEQRVHAS